MQVFTKEKKVAELALDHIGKTGESLQVMITALRAFAAGDAEPLAEATDVVNDLETEADTVLREIRDLLYSGAYLPTIRGDLYRLLSAVDKVANHVESCLDFVNYQRPAHVDRFRNEVRAILDLTEACFTELEGALSTYFEPKGEIDELRLHAVAASKIESKIDDQQRDLTTALFASDLPLAEKLHLQDFLLHLVSISDQAKSASQELELLSLKSII